MYNYTSSSVTVGVTSTLVIAANLNRHVLILHNDSNEDIYLGLGHAAVSATGIKLSKNTYDSEASRIILKEELNYTGAIYAICASGSKNLTIEEGQ